MCLAIPSKVVAVDGGFAEVERYGERLRVSLGRLLEPVKVGDFVIVQARSHAVERMSVDDAEAALRLFDELRERMESATTGELVTHFEQD